MEECREMFLHSDRGTASSDISGNRKQLFHRYKVAFLVPGHFCRGFEIDLGIAGDNAYEIPCPVP